MAKKLLAALLIIAAYVIPMAVGLRITAFAGFILVAMFINLVQVVNYKNKESLLPGAFVVWVIGMALTAILLLVTANAWLLWTVCLMFLIFWTMNDEDLFSD